MPSLAQQSLMIEALMDEGGHDMPRSMAAYRQIAKDNPRQWSWCIAEAARRKADRRMNDE